MSRGASRLHLTASEVILQVEGLKKAFRSGESELVLFENLSFQVARGEMLAIVGESGAGKSTLLHILGALDRASACDVYCARLRLSSLSDDAAAAYQLTCPIAAHEAALARRGDRRLRRQNESAEELVPETRAE